MEISFLDIYLIYSSAFTWVLDKSMFSQVTSMFKGLIFTWLFINFPISLVNLSFLTFHHQSLMKRWAPPQSHFQIYLFILYLRWDDESRERSSEDLPLTRIPSRYHVNSRLKVNKFIAIKNRLLKSIAFRKPIDSFT